MNEVPIAATVTTVATWDPRKESGQFTYVGSPVIVDHEPFEIRRPAPNLGQHTDEVLFELGLDRETIARLRDEQVV